MVTDGIPSQGQQACSPAMRAPRRLSPELRSSPQQGSGRASEPSVFTHFDTGTIIGFSSCLNPI